MEDILHTIWRLRNQRDMLLEKVRLLEEKLETFGRSAAGQRRRCSDAVREAVNYNCSCGGLGPAHEDRCDACRVWWALPDWLREE